MTIWCHRRLADRCIFSFASILLIVLGLGFWIYPGFGQSPNSEISDQSVNVINVTNSPISTYKNKDFGFMMDYPSSWIVLEDTLRFNTIAAFELIHTNIYDFTNTTLAEVDVRVLDNPGNIAASKLGIQDINPSNQTIISVSNTTLGGLPALRIVDYKFDGITTKHMQVWTVLPKHNVRLLIYYIAQPSLYDQYLNVVQHMIISFRLLK